LEALCRLAVLKALPTADEIAESEYSDAGAFLIQLCEDDKPLYTAFLKDPRTHAEWGAPLVGEPVAMRIGHLLSYIVRIIEGNVATRTSTNMKLSSSEVSRWAKKYLK
jgi:hypothetical protein